MDDDALGALSITLFGPVRATRGGVELRLGGPKVRLTLAVLASAMPRSVQGDQLIDLVWAENPPATARKTLQKHIVTLRRGLGERAIATEGAGYRLRLDTAQVDLFRFDQGLAAARVARAEGRLDRAWNAYVDTLAIGAARPLLGVGDVPFVADEARRWSELWLDGREEQVAVGLALGRHEEVVDLVDDLSRRHPLRERLHDSLMTALYRCGRHADALAVFQRHRRYLAEELGLSPSPALAELEARILRHDSTLLRRAENGRGVVLQRAPLSGSASSIGVLPFTDLSPAGDHGYFCDGLSEELIEQLSAVDGLRIASPTSSFRYRSSGLDVRSIGTELGVAAVLEGSVRRSGDRLRIVARLTDTRSGFQLCSDSFDRDIGDIFAVQHETPRPLSLRCRCRLSSSARNQSRRGRRRTWRPTTPTCRGDTTSTVAGGCRPSALANCFAPQ